MKRFIPLWITGLGGLAMIVSKFIPQTEGWGEDVATWFNILAAFAFVLGGGNLLKLHLQKISSKVTGWGYSVIILVSFIATLVIGLGKFGIHPSAEYPNVAWSGPTQPEGSAFGWVYEYLLQPLTATMFAMLAFYIASAAFRAFRAKNFEAFLLLATAFIILLGRTIAGVFITSWIPPNSPFAFLRLEELSVYIMQIFNTAGNRAIMIGIALGIASTSLKILLGIDRSYLGSSED
ncbi:MAG: hypothetical protein CMJ32_06375 [Phycisphaerae bacterium]|nr:hypothetical protein [Phycisphaerae bacterium]